jgi:hypothetical protein
MHNAEVELSYPVFRCDADWFRLIPSRFPPVDVYERLESATLRTAALQSEQQTNPRLVSKGRIAATEQSNRPSSGRLQNWNHAPFAYKNPEGTYLLGPAYGVMEVVHDTKSALAFYLRRREAFLGRTDEPPTGLDMRLLQTRIRGDFADLRGIAPDLSQAERRKIGQELYETEVSGAVFLRPDNPGATFIVVFDGGVLQPSIQGAHYRFAWDGTAIRSIYDFSSGKEIVRAELISEAPDEEAA